MEITFGNPQGSAPAPVIDTPTPTQPVAPVASVNDTPVSDTSVVVAQKPGALTGGGLLLGDKLPTLADIILPRINIVQGIGNLKDTFPQGGLIFGQTTLLFEPPQINKDGSQKVAGLPPVNMTVLGFRPTRFVEKVSGGARGMIVNTEAEVARAGGTLDYNEFKLKEKDGIRRFEPLAEAMVVIKRPEHLVDDGTIFVYDVEGIKYALALWAMKGTSYTAAAKKVFFTARGIGALREGGYPSFNYNVTTRLESYPGGNKAWIPICLIGTRSTPAFLDFVKSVLAA
jgi:hypothetical protein